MSGPAGITVPANPVRWKDRAAGAAITAFKKTIDETADLEHTEARIRAFADIRRDSGDFFFTDAQRRAISSAETPGSKEKIGFDVGVEKKSAQALPPILKVRALVGPILSNLTVREIARLAPTNTYFHTEGFQAIINQLMTKTSYTWQELNGYRQALGQSSVKELLTLFPVMSSNTKSLDLSKLNITSIQFEQLIKFFPNLTSVNFAFCSSHTDAAVRALARGCPKLTSIYTSLDDGIQQFKRYRKEFAYRPTSAIGTFYRRLLDEAPIGDLKQAIQEVDSKFLNRVYVHVWNLSKKPKGEDKWGEIHALDEDKRNILIAALQKGITERFESLPQENKDSIYGKVYNLSTDRNPLDALDNRALLADLLSGTARKPDESKKGKRLRPCTIL